MMKPTKKDDCEAMPAGRTLYAEARSEWKKDHEGNYACARCGYLPPHDHDLGRVFLSRYCPDCGIKMENGRRFSES